MPHQWSDYERHVLDIGFGELYITGGDMEGIFRHVFANDWGPANTPTAKRLIDEWTTRRHPSRSHRSQQEIDRSSYTAAQQADRSRARNAIQNGRTDLGQVTAQSAAPSITAASQNGLPCRPVAAPAMSAATTNMPPFVGAFNHDRIQKLANIASNGNEQGTSPYLLVRLLVSELDLKPLVRSESCNQLK